LDAIYIVFSHATLQVDAVFFRYWHPRIWTAAVYSIFPSALVSFYHHFLRVMVKFLLKVVMQFEDQRCGEEDCECALGREY
jgi:hypothetical protein